MSDNINYEELKIFINKHKNYFGKNLDSALKVIENAEQSKSTPKPINILNRLEDLNIKRGDAKFNSEVRPELRKLLGLGKKGSPTSQPENIKTNKTPPALPKREIKIDYEKIKRLINELSGERLGVDKTISNQATQIVCANSVAGQSNPETLYVDILNKLLEKEQRVLRSDWNEFKYLLRILLGINTTTQAKALEKSLKKVTYINDDEEDSDGIIVRVIPEFDDILKKMPEWCGNL